MHYLLDDFIFGFYYVLAIALLVPIKATVGNTKEVNWGWIGKIFVLSFILIAIEQLVNYIVTVLLRFPIDNLRVELFSILLLILLGLGFKNSKILHSLKSKH